MLRSIQYIIYAAIFAMMFALGSCRSARNVSKSQGAKDSPTVVLPKEMAEEMRADQRKLVEEALTWIGTPYRYGGKSRTGTDCSGMTMVVYQDALGIALPRSSREQQQFCKSIKKSALDAGDLIFFSTGRDKSRVSHVGMYIGDNKFIHASGSRGVIVSDIGEKYYATNYHSSGHVARSMDKTKKSKVKDKKPVVADSVLTETSTAQTYEITLDKFLELNKRQNEIDEAIEAKVDSIYSSFLD